MTKSTAERQRAYKARKQAQGLVRVAEWVHKDDAALMRHYAELLKLEWQVNAAREHRKFARITVAPSDPKE